MARRANRHSDDRACTLARRASSRRSVREYGVVLTRTARARRRGAVSRCARAFDRRQRVAGASFHRSRDDARVRIARRWTRRATDDEASDDDGFVVLDGGEANVRRVSPRIDDEHVRIFIRLWSIFRRDAGGGRTRAIPGDAVGVSGDAERRVRVRSDRGCVGVHRSGNGSRDVDDDGQGRGGGGAPVGGDVWVRGDAGIE